MSRFASYTFWILLALLVIQPKAVALEPPSDLQLVLDKSSSTVAVVSNAGTFPGTNIRHDACLGTRGGPTQYDVGANWFNEEYDNFARKIKEAAPGAFEDVYACVIKKFRWREFYVNKRLAPRNRTEAQDPNWSNYRWNNVDIIGQLLASDPIVAGEAKLSVLIADSSTAENSAMPSWFISAGYVFGDSSKRVLNIRLWDKNAREALIDFYIAFLRKYGNEQGLHGLALGEYFLETPNLKPSDWSAPGYYRGRRDVWREISAAAPLDESGRRLAIFQTHPLLGHGVSAQDLIELGVGVSQSDTKIFLKGCGSSAGCDKGSWEWLLNQVSGKVPTMINGDSKMAVVGRKFPFPANNPFGYAAGSRHSASPQALLWYHGTKGFAPVNSFFLMLEWTAEPQTLENYIDGVKRFGAGGSESNRWGVSPTPATN